MPLSRGAAARCALIIGHPGHELRVLGWLRAVRPLIAVLTDGSGHGDHSRLPLTARLVEDTGARVSRLFGMTTDRRLYRAILEQDTAFFLALADQVANLLVEERIGCVVGDAIEGYNPAHDICRLIIDRAVRLAQHETGTEIRNDAFSLVSAAGSDGAVQGWRVRLNPKELADKVSASRRYAQAAGPMLQSEVEELLRTHGERTFAQEMFFPMQTVAALERFNNATPYYETHGARQVAAGRYTCLIRFREHMAPLAATLAS